MDIFTRIAGQFRSYWNNASLAGRIATGASVLMLIATVVAAGVWSSTPDYKLLRDNISPQMTASIKSVLDTNGIPNRMNFAGTAVMVQSSRWNEANIAISSLDVPSVVDGTTTPNPLLPQRAGHPEKIRAKERAIESTIESLRVVKSANVHLAVPEPSPFRRERPPASATVVVEPQHNQVISREHGMGIVQLVASAVEGLDPKNVSLVNSSGNLLGATLHADPATKRREFIRQLEAELAMKAEDVLAVALGPRKAIVRVSASVDDYTEKTITTNRIESKGKVTTKEIITESNQQSLASRGITGTGANGGGTADTSSPQTVGKEKTNETTYAYPEIVETTQQVGGQVLGLSVAAMVDVTPDGDDPATATPLLTQKQVEEKIMAAVGFKASRGDVIDVTLGEIPDEPTIALAEAIPETEKWSFVLQLARHASLGLAAVVALLIATMTLKKMQPISIPLPENEKRRSDLLTELSARVDQNPEAVSKILAAWLGQPDMASAQEAMKKAA